MLMLSCEKKKAERNLKKLMHSLINFPINPLVHTKKPGSYFLTIDSILTPLHSITIIEIHPYGLTRCLILHPNKLLQRNIFVEIIGSTLFGLFHQAIVVLHKPIFTTQTQRIFPTTYPKM